MARTVDEIKADLVERQQELIPGLSSSQTADWFIWVSIFAYAIYLFEVIMDVFIEDVESQLQKKQPGTLEWYSEKALAFQNGHTLQVDQWGVVGYAADDASAKIVKHASVIESGGNVIIKVATINDETNELEPLSVAKGDFINFQRYMNKIKFAGTSVSYKTLTADIIDYDVSVYYDPLYVPANVQASVLAALNDFRTELSFNARLYKSDFISAIQAVEGVKTVKVNNMVISPAEGDPVALDVVEELVSGYFNYSATSIISMINVDA